MVAFLYASQCISSKEAVDTPPMMRSPLEYLSRPPTILSSVVLPQPLGPRIDTNSCSLKDSETPRRACTVVVAEG